MLEKSGLWFFLGGIAKTTEPVLIFSSKVRVLKRQAVQFVVCELSQ